MIPPNNLDLQSNLNAFPLAEVLTEIAQARLDGSLRLARDEQKIIIYFNEGTVVFAVSNVRRTRIFDILLSAEKIDKKTLSEIPNFTNDLELAEKLIEKNLFSKAEIDALFIAQIEDILKTAFEWKTGEWTFSPLARIKEGIGFKINLRGMLAEYGRKLSAETVFERFKDMQETFTAKDFAAADIDLQPHEAFVLSRFGDAKMSIEEIRILSGLPEPAAFQTLYVLWLSGFLTRQNQNAVFSESKINEILSANVRLKKEVAHTTPKTADKKAEPPKDEISTENRAVAEEISLEDYLERAEKSVTHYEVLDVAVKADTTDIKTAYFALAKRFHPDHFHKETDTTLHNRIQKAFSKIAQAYENLKTPDTREAYDFKMRKELAERERRQNLTEAKSQEMEQTDLASENFEQGLGLLLDDEYAEAQPFLARAVHLAPNVARYHAYFGKLLSGDTSQRHKAEGELQTAIKLEPENPTFRIMLVEFFIEYNLMKRAEGELNRLLAVFPDHSEAKKLLDSLQNK